MIEFEGVTFDDIPLNLHTRTIDHPGSLSRHKSIIDEQLNVITGTTPYDVYQYDPVRWAKERANVVPWSKQCEILEAVAHHRRVAVRSCHNVGKTFIAASVVGWWIDSHPPGSAFVVTTAPTGPQVKALLWREINRLHRNADLPGRTNLTEWYVNNELVAFGRKPSEYNESAFQGIHEMHVLVVLDEACGIPSSLWVAAESIASNKGGHILAIGNPDKRNTDFEQKFLPESRWKKIHIAYDDTPNFTREEVPQYLRDNLISREWVDDMRIQWGESSALWQSKVLGEFPTDAIDPWAVIPLSFLRECFHLGLPETDTVEAGIDVAAGGDRTVIAERRGFRVGRIESFRSSDPMKSVGQLVECINDWGITRVKIDVIGIGWGVYGRLRELSLKHNPTGEWSHSAEVIPINFGEKSRYPKRFLNKRAEVWWTVGREFSRLYMWDLTGLDEEAINELKEPQFEIMDSYGKIKIEPKEKVRTRIGRSPDIADALLLAFYNGHTVEGSNRNSVKTFENANLLTESGSQRSPFGSLNGNRVNGASVFNNAR